jgi:hypothetical protein
METINCGGSKDGGLDIGGFFVINRVFGIVIHHHYQRDEEGGQGVQLVKKVGVALRELECVNFVNSSRHSCSLVGKVIGGCIALRSIYMFVFAVFNDFDNMVVVMLLQFKVNTRKFGRNVGMGNVQLNKAISVFKIVALPVILLPLFIKKFEGLCLVFLLVASSPIFNDFDGRIQHGEGGDCMGF